jgi:hypothetical protein
VSSNVKCANFVSVDNSISHVPVLPFLLFESFFSYSPCSSAFSSFFPDAEGKPDMFDRSFVLEQFNSCGLSSTLAVRGAHGLSYPIEYPAFAQEFDYFLRDKQHLDPGSVIFDVYGLSHFRYLFIVGRKNKALYACFFFLFAAEMKSRRKY